MELCPNGSLASLIRRAGPLALGDALDLGFAVCGALAAAHEAGILHRDVKPANVPTTYYICGSSGFADAASRLLTDRGVPPGAIRIECFAPGRAPRRRS